MVGQIRALNVSQRVFGAYAFWVAVLVIKMLAMVILTGIPRFRNNSFATPEDVRAFNLTGVVMDDPEVERVRRAHRNDLEAILPFFIIGFLYMFVMPNETLAVWLYRIAALTRIVHTIVYAVWVIPQPARSISFSFCYLITMYMAIHCMVHFIRHI